MKRLMLGIALITAVTASVPMGAQGQNSDPNAKAKFLGAIHKSGKKATLEVRYRCAEGEAVWVSAKQSKSGDVDRRLTKEGSSKLATSWLQSHRNKFTCNGKSHTATFAIDTVEKGSKGKLKPGRAWVQFCVTKGQETLILSKSGWVEVI